MAWTHIGVILVHGIGEQKRFEHLDGEIRQLIEGLRRQWPHGPMTVEVRRVPVDVNMAHQPVWQAGEGGTVQVFLRDTDQPDGGMVVHVHEVWWADVNEPYSVAKQLRFWLWGMTVWAFPAKFASGSPLARSNMLTLWPKAAEVTLARVKILAASTLFLLSSFSLGLLFATLKRLLGIETPDIVRTFTNYLSSIKLYNQKQRTGLGLPGDNADFLDNLRRPPRTSIRKRMIEAIIDVALSGYDRWHVVAHSLGSVVALNGLMEPAYVVPHYLDQERVALLRARQMIRPVPQRHQALPSGAPGGAVTVAPDRPPWVAANEVADRQVLFERFAGLVTYGSPIGKFGAIWPGKVQVCREPAFPPDARWINVHDPLDPVSGPTRNFDPDHLPRQAGNGVQCCPRKVDVGFTASWVLLQAHVRYLKSQELCDRIRAWFGFRPCSRGPFFVDALAAWMISGGAWATPGGRRFFGRDSSKARLRTLVASAWVVVAFLGVGFLSLWALEHLIHGLRSASCPHPQSGPHAPPACGVWAWLDIPQRALEPFRPLGAPFPLAKVVALIVGMFAACLVAGGAARLFPWFSPDQDSEAKPDHPPTEEDLVPLAME